MVRGLKAGLLALTALATIAPAVAQDNNGWRGRSGERQGGGAPGGRQAGQASPGGWQGGDRNGRGAGGGNDGGGRAMNGGGGQWQNRAPRAEAPAAPAVAPQAAPSRQDVNPRFRGYTNLPWQGRTQGVVTSPPLNNAGRPDADRGGATGWQNRDGNRDGRIGSAIGGQDRNWNRDNRPNNNGQDRNWNRDNRPNNNNWQGGGNWNRDNRPSTNWQNRDRINDRDRWQDQRRWNNDWRRDNRYDWNSYRRYNRDVYRLPAYRAPYGWSSGYRSFSIGVYLGSGLYNNDYWIDDPWTYRLPPAYGSLRWVRYYDDALLVDVRDGYVVDVIRNFFW